MTKQRAKRKKYNMKRIILASGSIVLLVGAIITSIFLLNNKGTAGQFFTKEKEESTMNMLGVIELKSDEDYALLGDYELVFAMLMQQDMSGYDEAALGEIEVNRALVQEKLDFEDLSGLEEAINTLAASIDKPFFNGESSELQYTRGLLILNKVYSAPANFAPGDRTIMMNAFYEMQAAAKSDGINLHDFSNYRSYYTQDSLYNRYVAADGQAAADRYSAKPGYSEHQSGFAMDIGGDDRSAWAETTFDGSTEALWLEEHAHEYGFILRYMPGKEDITGYMHESWHFRYVGPIATKVYESGLTLEEYLGLV